MMMSDVQKFGPYLILERVGDGGMAEIFLAKLQGYSGFEKLLALKKILPRYSQNPAFAQMLIHEAKLAAALQHFNVVQVLDLGEIEGQVFISMEYVRGRDLAAVLSHTYRRQERLPLDLVICIATEFMTGLDYAHRFRNAEGVPLAIIHRDISPQNILISYEGEVKVTDFGIARVLSEKDGFQLPGNIQGKFGYMSPEQVRGEDIDQRSDIFSAGVVLYEMLTGQRLFRSKDHHEIVQMVLSKEIAPPSSINPEVSPALDRVAAKALARDRNLRHQTMGALLGELARIGDKLPRRAATRDLAVYMRRQFGHMATGFTGQKSDSASLSNISGFRSPSEISSLGGHSTEDVLQRIPLGAILLDRGIISPSDLDIALAEQRARGGRIGELLIASGSVSEDALLQALAVQTKFPVATEEILMSLLPPDKLIKRFPREAAEATWMLPMALDEHRRTVCLAVSDPYDERGILEAKVVMGVGDVVIHLAKRSVIRKVIRAWYGDQTDMLVIESPVFSESNSSPEFSTVPKYILLADGELESLSELIARIRAEEQCALLLASEGKTARKLCREHSIAIAILDASLPQIDGFHILLELRTSNSDATVFMSASRSAELEQTKAFELGADDFLIKPLSTDVIMAKIRRELHKRASATRALLGPINWNGISGSLQDMSVLDIMQMLELGRKTTRVSLQYQDGRQGELFTTLGDLSAAVSGELSGEEAFFQLARPVDGWFRIEYQVDGHARNIFQPNTYLMIEAMRRLDMQALVANSGHSNDYQRLAGDLL